MTIELSVWWVAGVVGVSLILILLRVGIAVGRRTERRNWVSVADTHPKSFIYVPEGQYTVFSQDEWDKYNLLEIESGIDS